jgi:hypothetical protein
MRKHLYHDAIDYSVITSNIVSPGFNCCKMMAYATITLEADSRIGCVCKAAITVPAPGTVIELMVVHF